MKKSASHQWHWDINEDVSKKPTTQAGWSAPLLKFALKSSAHNNWSWNPLPDIMGNYLGHCSNRNQCDSR